MAHIIAQTEADVIDAVAAARANGTTLEIVGAATKRAFGNPVRADDMLDVSGLSGIISYEPEELVLSAKAGTRIAEIESAVRAKGQKLGFDPADWGPLLGAGGETATVGGVVSANACGSARIRFGAARDHLLGFRAVNGLGESYKAGGRVVKNVTGFDLPKLMCGAMGTLGVLTEMTLRLVPCALLSETLIVRDASAETGLELLRRAWTSACGPTGLAYVPSRVGSVFPELGGIGAGAALIRVEGARVPLDEKLAGIRALSPDMRFDLIDGESLFRSIGNGAMFIGTDADIWRVAVPPASAARCVIESGTELWLADWAGGMLWIAAPPADKAFADNIRATAASFAGHATLLRAAAEWRCRVGAFQPEPASLAALTRSVKGAFDPLGIFNPGRMGP
ncbi:MAG: FAD-binding protein [Rhizomicrobium sp.]|jgi:glycolate oxidase FAD binding subunit